MIQLEKSVSGVLGVGNIVFEWQDKEDNQGSFGQQNCVCACVGAPSLPRMDTEKQH